LADIRFCHMILDTSQPRVETLFNKSFKRPMFDYPPLLELARGFSPNELTLRESRVDSTQIVSPISRRMEDG